MKYADSLRTAALLASVLPFATLSADFKAASDYIDLDGSMVGYMEMVITADMEEISVVLSDGRIISQDL